MKKPDPIRGVEIRECRLKDGTVHYEYRVRWKNPATGRKEVEICRNAQDALDFKAKLRLLKRRGALTDLDRGRETLATFAPRWLTQWATVNLTTRALRNYASVYNKHILPRIGHLQLRHINTAVVDQLKNDLTTAGVGNPTIRRVLTVLQAMLRQAVVWGEITYNPVREVEKPPAHRTKVITPLTVQQVETILAYLGEHAGIHDRMLAELLAYGAGRPQDILALPWGHIGTQRLVYSQKNIDGTIAPGSKTGSSKARSVAMLPTLRADLLKHRMATAHGTGPLDLVVVRPDGQPWREHDYKNWSRKEPRGKRDAQGRRRGQPSPFARAAIIAGVPGITPYFLRHTYASLRLAEQKLSLSEIAEEMGHDVETLASTYAHVISDYRGQGPIDPDQLIQEARRNPKRPENAPTPAAETGS